MDRPPVTVLMPVYNGQKHLREAVDGILAQTFPDFEFLVIDDGSTDDTPRILQSLQDARISVIRNDTNAGLAASLNKGIRLARGGLIARMDCDDISLPARLEKQVAFMNANASVGVCGTGAICFGDGKEQRWRHPASDAAIRARLFFGNSIVHSSAMIRRSVLTDNNLGYDESLDCAQDYDLWTRISRHTKLANLDEPLVRYRVHKFGITGTTPEKDDFVTPIRLAQLRRLIPEPSDDEVRAHLNLCESRRVEKRSELADAIGWAHFLQEKNLAAGRPLPEKEFLAELSGRLFAFCRLHTHFGMLAWRNFRKSGLSRSAPMNISQRIRFFAKCLLKYDSSRR